ncbi:methyltransferase [Streptomyces sp. L2]|uniref:methyltransferase n=1 Tax=Streptomyces sp. L2 TaxID=2162665 RepID=UPI001F50A7EC|nr:methyltransferase [Streptomyces sp. L2]
MTQRVGEPERVSARGIEPRYVPGGTTRKVRIVTHTSSAVLGTFRDYILGPTRFMNLMSCFELGIITNLTRFHPAGLTAQQIADATGTTAHNVEQLMQLPVKDGFLSYNEKTGTYALEGLGRLSEAELDRVLPWMSVVKEVCLRQLYYLTDSVRTGKIVGLEQLYGVTGNFYAAGEALPDLHVAWAKTMSQVSAFIDPWFFNQLDLPENAKVLDLAGNTGQGALLAHQHHPGKNLHVTCFDLPEKEAETLENFRTHGVEEHCSFIGGDAFAEVPRGFDIIMIKHFLDMWDRDSARRILDNVFESLDVGGKVIALSLTYPEDTIADAVADFFPAYFLGCTMAQGGPQKLTTYTTWLKESGFDITNTITQDPATLTPDTIPIHSIICATKKSR